MFGNRQTEIGPIPVNEVYPSVQGEATWTGTPAWFVRTMGCPVGCPWCDTKYTWDLAPENRVSPTTLDAKSESDRTWGMMHPDTLLALLHQRRGIRHVVITGGEPAMHDLSHMVRTLLANEYRVQLETSGTFPLIGPMPMGLWVTCSPKIGMPGGRAVLLTMLQRADEIKFPIGRESDMQQLERHVLPFIRPNVPVWLQPISQSKKATELCVAEASRRGMRISVQVHKYLDLP
jgi:7-carboxy-7-deazaguanine synthase